MAQVTGTVYIRVNGKMLRSEEGASLNPGGFSREAKMANATLTGYQAKPMPAEMECKIHHTSDTDIIEMSNYTDATLKFETDTGKSYLVTNAFTADPAELEDGLVSLKMIGDAAIEE
jgi:hypothetical protein